MKRTYITLTTDIEFLVEIIPGVDGKPEVQKVSCPTICIKTADIDLSEFTDKDGKTIADMLLNDHADELDRMVEVENEAYRVEHEKDQAWESYHSVRGVA